MKRILALILAILMMATLFVGCGDTDSGNGKDKGDSSDATEILPEEGATLKLWAPDAALDVFEAQCDAFIEKYADYDISIEVVPQGESNVSSVLINDPEKGADVFSFPVDHLEDMVDAMAIAPVSPVLAEDVTARNSAESVSGATLNYEGTDTLFAFPETGDNGYYLVYDKSVVTDEDAQTLEGVLAACKKANKKFIVPAEDGFFACMFPFTGGLAPNGLEVNDDGDKTQIFNDYDEDAVVDALEAFAALFHEYSDIFYSADAVMVGSSFSQNPRTAAAGIDGGWNATAVAGYLGDDYGAVKLPTINVKGEDKQIIPMLGYKLLGVNAVSKYPAAAQLLADYLSSEECQLERADKLSWGPSNTVAAESDIVKNNPAISAILSQAEFAVPQSNIVSTFWNPMGTLGAGLFKEEDYSREALKELLDITISTIKDE